MTLLCFDEIFSEHRTSGHPESPERLERVWQHLQTTGLVDRCQREAWLPATLGQLTRIHDSDYVDQIQRFAESGGGKLDADTIVSPLSHFVALQASGAVCHSVDAVVEGRHPNALCLVRPPGHHARPSAAMGFCLFNHIAVGAQHAVSQHGLNRVLVVDWDVHHGNGTQEAFYESEQVGFLSLHRWPFYPGTGSVEETGSGPGAGTTSNVNISLGTERDVYLSAFRVSLEDIARRLEPELILISAGFDAHRSDPIGSLGLETEDYGELTRIVMQVANQYCQGRIVSMLEGGYNPGVLPACVEQHLTELLAA